MDDRSYDLKIVYIWLVFNDYFHGAAFFFFHLPLEHFYFLNTRVDIKPINHSNLQMNGFSDFCFFSFYFSNRFTFTLFPYDFNESIFMGNENTSPPIHTRFEFSFSIFHNTQVNHISVSRKVSLSSFQVNMIDFYE